MLTEARLPSTLITKSMGVFPFCLIPFRLILGLWLGLGLGLGLGLRLLVWGGG